MKKKLQILVLMHSHAIPPENATKLGEQDFEACKAEHDVLEALGELGHRAVPLAIDDELAPIRRAIEEHEPDLVFNMLTHFQDVGFLDAYVVAYLELHRMPCTGCNPRGLMLASHKALAKKILTYHRIPVPHFESFPRGKALRPPRKLHYPLFVKSIQEHASTGISQASIVRDEKSLFERVEYVHDSVGTDAMAEEYIEGRELSIGVLGNHRLSTFPVWEVLFPNLPPGSAPIQTSRVKTDVAYQKKIGLTSGPAAELPEGKAREIERIARRAYRVLEMSGFARVDLRMTAEGRVYLLEANPNPDLSFREDFAEAAEAAGIAYQPLIQRVCNLGMRYQPSWK